MNTLFKTVTTNKSQLVSMSASNQTQVPDVPKREYTRIFVSDLQLDMYIGVNPEEYDTKQRVRVEVEVDIEDSRAWRSDDISDTLSYEDLVQAIQNIASQGHIKLVEKFAEDISDFSLNQPGVDAVKVRVSKLDVYSGLAVPGVEISRTRQA